ncbi:family 78 glycoside hydrolase catalytic domain [Microbacterium sp. 4R-513]|uniref:alpha-L-rhamnosidase n=1 Tax=Microbacterium sp. 4R-513 TaxID=2567934 RepID=UPI0013E18AC9|nr:alpha-L-rhamnosidase [Microbacterium sp. 4R-513]QIG39482.1 family 78 glycoside hydrolase catalytic domain [Microbacterium sp. 4R-513]
MSDRIARFIAPETKPERSPLLRTEVDLDGGHGRVVRATVDVSALGIVEAFIDGIPVSDDVLTPGWTSYEWRVRYATYDVTSHVASAHGARIALGLALGDGWYRGRLGWDDAPPYGPEIAGFLELRITFEDGHEQVVVTDESWRAAAGPVVSDSIYDGQHIDARASLPGWNRVGFDDHEWMPVHVVDFDLEKLEPYVGPPVRRQDSIAPARVWTSPAGKTLVDFGQNLVGWVRVSVRGEAGQAITLRHAEVLEDGELGTRPLRTAKATDVFVLSGGDDVFEPTFTFHGFRYVEVEGWPGGADAIAGGALTAVVVSSELRRIGRFKSSDPLLNQLHENVVWGMRGNFLDVPTDCPQRDERLGWTGDIAVFAATSTFLFDVGGFLRDWLRDLALEQAHQDGVVPFVVPDILKKMGIPEDFAPVDTTAVWSDAVAWVPWALWRAYGDEDLLAETFPAMAAHARRVRSLLSPTGVWDRGFQFGDWLDPDAPPSDPANAKADRGVVATAAAYRTARIVAEAAAILGRAEDATEFAELADRLRRGFQAEYVDDERIVSDCTTVYSLAIAFGLLDEQQQSWAGDRLAELVRESGFHISTGFAGTPFIMDALTSTGHLDEAYALLMQRECPSWLYPVTMGATTVWERWDSMLPDGSINPGEMTSFNHYALGAVADWMHRVLGGLAAIDPGYARLEIAPRPGGGVEWAKTSLATPHGLASVEWETDADVLRVVAVVPDGATAIFRPAGSADVELGPGTHRLTAPASVALPSPADATAR